MTKGTGDFVHALSICVPMVSVTADLRHDTVYASIHFQL